MSENRGDKGDSKDHPEGPLKAPSPEPVESESRDSKCHLEDPLEGPSNADPPGAMEDVSLDVHIV